MNERIQALARLLVDHGLQYAFGVTGSGSSLSLITELEALGVRYFPAVHEASAALMAGAVTKATKSLSISISIKGPGLANMVPGIASNYFEGYPALSVSEAFGADVPSFHKHKRLDQETMLASFVKGCISLDDVERQLEVLLQVAQAEAPGPVHLNLCLHGQDIFPSEQDHERQLEGQKTRQLFFQYLKHSKCPAVIVGSLASRRGWSKQLTNLRVPVFTTVSAKGVLSERLEHSAGVFTGDGKELTPESQLFSQSDLVVGIGLRNTEVLSVRPPAKPLVIVDEVDSGLSEGFECDACLHDPSGQVIPEVLNELQAKSWGTDQIALLRRKMCKELLSKEWLPPVCFDVLNDLSFAHGLVVDTGSFCTIAEHIWQQLGEDRVFMGSSNGRFMGTSIPSAIGTAISKPGFPVFCVVGDGGMAMYPAEIKLAIRENLPICLILMSDGLYGSVACVPQSKPMNRRAVTISEPSWLRSRTKRGGSILWRPDGRRDDGCSG